LGKQRDAQQNSNQDDTHSTELVHGCAHYRRFYVDGPASRRRKNCSSCSGTGLEKLSGSPLRGCSISSSAECRKFLDSETGGPDFPRISLAAPYRASPTTGWPREAM